MSKLDFCLISTPRVKINRDLKQDDAFSIPASQDHIQSGEFSFYQGGNKNWRKYNLLGVGLDFFVGNGWNFGGRGSSAIFVPSNEKEYYYYNTLKNQVQKVKILYEFQNVESICSFLSKLTQNQCLFRPLALIPST